MSDEQVLDTKKPIQRKKDKKRLHYIGTTLLGNIVAQLDDPFVDILATYLPEELENIPEPVIIEADIEFTTTSNGRGYITFLVGSDIDVVTGKPKPRARISYTRNAKDPWRFEVIHN